MIEYVGYVGIMEKKMGTAKYLFATFPKVAFLGSCRMLVSILVHRWHHKNTEYVCLMMHGLNHAQMSTCFA